MGTTSRHAEGVVPYEAPKIVLIFIVYTCGSSGVYERGQRECYPYVCSSTRYSYY